MCIMQVTGQLRRQPDLKSPVCRTGACPGTSNRIIAAPASHLLACYTLLRKEWDKSAPDRMSPFQRIRRHHIAWHRFVQPVNDQVPDRAEAEMQLSVECAAVPGQWLASRNVTVTPSTSRGCLSCTTFMRSYDTCINSFFECLHSVPAASVSSLCERSALLMQAWHSSCASLSGSCMGACIVLIRALCLHATGHLGAQSAERFVHNDIFCSPSAGHAPAWQ